MQLIYYYSSIDFIVFAGIGRNWKAEPAAYVVLYSSGGTPSIKGGGALPTFGPILSMQRP